MHSIILGMLMLLFYQVTLKTASFMFLGIEQMSRLHQIYSCNASDKGKAEFNPDHYHVCFMFWEILSQSDKRIFQI